MATTINAILSVPEQSEGDLGDENPGLREASFVLAAQGLW